MPSGSIRARFAAQGSRLLIQEGIARGFHPPSEGPDGQAAPWRSAGQMHRRRCAVVDPVQLKTIKRLVAGSGRRQFITPPASCPEKGCFYPPTLISGLSTADPLMQEEIFGPVLVSTTFRTPGEAVELANNTRYGLAATLWTENVNLALDIAPKLAAGVVWVNATNLFDAAAGFGGVREIGLRARRRLGGAAGLYQIQGQRREETDACCRLPRFGRRRRRATRWIALRSSMSAANRRAPMAGYSKPVSTEPEGQADLGHVGIANRKDVRNAVEAMNAAKGWAKTTGHLRAQILYYMGENLSSPCG